VQPLMGMAQVSTPIRAMNRAKSSPDSRSDEERNGTNGRQVISGASPVTAV